jgi:hypothetical protein
MLRTYRPPFSRVSSTFDVASIPPNEIGLRLATRILTGCDVLVSPTPRLTDLAH